MSREVRRVPIDYQHPLVMGKGAWGQEYMAPQRLKSPSYSEALEAWLEEKRQWGFGIHPEQEFILNYHGVEGYLDRDGVRHKATPYIRYDNNGEMILGGHLFSSMEDLITHYSIVEEIGEKPTRDTHMPDFTEDEGPLGYCLYETVSEGTPATPVFATQEELIEYLATVGEYGSGTPLRLEAAEALVRQGGSFGSFQIRSGELLDSTRDADKVAAL